MGAKMMVGKTVLVTGCQGQLGSAAARLLADEGATVIGVDRQKRNDPRLAIDEYLRVDVAIESEVERLAHHLSETRGVLDAYIHTAFTAEHVPLLDQTLAQWRSTIDGTLTSTFLLARHLVPSLERSGAGAIVNVSSIISRVPAADNAAYGAAKAGVNQFTRNVAHDFARRGVRANAVLAGVFFSDERLATLPEETQSYVRRNTWMGRAAAAAEIAQVAVFLASSRSSYVTGALIEVDGGFAPGALE